MDKGIYQTYSVIRCNLPLNNQKGIVFNVIL